MVSPQRIRYNGVDSTDLLNLIFDVAFDSDNGTTSSFLNRSAVAADSHDGRYRNTARYKYDELFSPRFTIVKQDFTDFTQSEVRQVLKYLTSTDKPALLEVYDDESSNAADWVAIGGWTEIETYKIANNRTVGIVATFEAITPYAMSDLWTATKTVSENTFDTITIDTDENQAVYPRIIIQQTGSVIRVPDNTIYTHQSNLVENTVYFNGTTYYWKPSTIQYRTSNTLPTDDYNKDWPVKTATVTPTSATMENNTIYAYNDVYYWIDPPYTFRSSTIDPELPTTSVRIRNIHTDSLDTVTNLGVVIAQSTALTDEVREWPIETVTSIPAVTTMESDTVYLCDGIYYWLRHPNEVVIKNNTPSEKIILDGANKIISSSNTQRIFGDDFVDWRWLGLYGGDNDITVEGNCTVTLEWRKVLKLGEW